MDKVTLKAALQVILHQGGSGHEGFRLKNGHQCEGYIERVDDETVTMSEGGPYGGWSRTYELEEIDPSSLFYWSDSLGQFLEITRWPTPWPTRPVNDDEEVV